MESAASDLQAHTRKAAAVPPAASAALSTPFHAHAVQFYEDDSFLTGIVGEQLRQALAARRPAIIIATPEHRTLFAEYLRKAGVDVDAARSRDLARRMAGDLVVESAPGAGSTFTLTLPRV